jgi:hypothetical protein
MATIALLLEMRNGIISCDAERKLMPVLCFVIVR